MTQRSPPCFCVSYLRLLTYVIVDGRGNVGGKVLGVEDGLVVKPQLEISVGETETLNEIIS